ncbi:hypothetical protein SHKM778_83310 [Streptomyces sp. KM77-8]|uniref:Uncharacterized protein n=1 Tax=Streptomyces haneummycinicus TaxID=3074435 RepID=A0AAT9HXL7_9ACTN
MPHHRVRITDERHADVDGTPVIPAPEESVHEAVLDRLQRYAQEQGSAVRATIDDGSGTGHFLLEVHPDGASRILDTTEEPPPTAPTPARGETAAAGPAGAPDKQAGAPDTGPDPDAGPGAQFPAPDAGPAAQFPDPDAGPGAQFPAPDVGPAAQFPAPDAGSPPQPSGLPGPPAAPSPHAPSSPGAVPPRPASADDAPAPSSATPSRAPSALALAVTRARGTAASGDEKRPTGNPVPASAPARTSVLALAPPPAVGLPGGIAERIRRVNEATTAGRLDEAYADATALRERLAAAVGAEHPHAVEARALEAYLAHRCGLHREATVLALGVARIRCRAGDGRAAADVARATAAWLCLDDDRAIAAHGTELLRMWNALRKHGALTPTTRHSPSAPTT